MSSAKSAEARSPRPTPIPPPEPIPSRDELIARAVALRPRLYAEQDESEKRGAHSPEMHEEFRRAGFYRITQPKMFGGFEYDLGTFYKCMVEVSRGDPGSGWCLTLAASHAFLVASHWPERAQREIFGPTGEFAAPHRALPMGTATPTKDGYIINGRWNYCSGIPYATHFIGTAFLKDGQEPPRTVLTIVPRGSYTILPDWGGDHVLGMCASGSNSVEVKDVLIPEDHIVPVQVLFARPDGMENGTPGTRLHGNPMYLGRLVGPYHASLVSIIVGAAWAAIDEYERVILAMKPYGDPTILRADHYDYQREFGLALAQTEAAEAILMAAAQRYMDLCARWAADGTVISVEDNLRLWTLLQQAGKLACDSVEALFHITGAFATKKGNKLQRYFRDVQMYRTHSSAQYEEFATYTARVHLGRPSGFRGL